jgi:hypothetical protein
MKSFGYFGVCVVFSLVVSQAHSADLTREEIIKIFTVDQPWKQDIRRGVTDERACRAACKHMNYFFRTRAAVWQLFPYEGVQKSTDNPTLTFLPPSTVYPFLKGTAEGAIANLLLVLQTSLQERQETCTVTYMTMQEETEQGAQLIEITKTIRWFDTDAIGEIIMQIMSDAYLFPAPGGIQTSDVREALQNDFFARAKQLFEMPTEENPGYIRVHALLAEAKKWNFNPEDVLAADKLALLSLQ